MYTEAFDTNKLCVTFRNLLISVISFSRGFLLLLTLFVLLIFIMVGIFFSFSVLGFPF